MNAVLFPQGVDRGVRPNEAATSWRALFASTENIFISWRIRLFSACEQSRGDHQIASRPSGLRLHEGTTLLRKDTRFS
jgi:hypothetical protein